MRRFRLRRRRALAAALAPLTAILASASLATGAEPEPTKNARIDASKHRVAVGETVALRGAFPGAGKAPIAIRHRAKGSTAWRVVARARTGASGLYRVRVKPRRIGYWRAELAAAPEPQAASEDGIAASSPTQLDKASGAEKVVVRSRTKAEVRGRHATVADAVKVHGTVAPAGEKRRVVVEIGGSEITTRASRSGRFEATWRAPRTGRFPVRVRAASNRLATASRDRAGAVTVYRPAAASWYGPGLYGNAMACGGTLTPSTLGVAHKTLPCGTKLRLRYGSRSVAVRVVDRGPYSGNREFDLTSATKQALGFGDVGTVLSSR